MIVSYGQGKQQDSQPCHTRISAPGVIDQDTDNASLGGNKTRNAIIFLDGAAEVCGNDLTLHSRVDSLDLLCHSSELVGRTRNENDLEQSRQRQQTIHTGS